LPPDLLLLAKVGFSKLKLADGKVTIDVARLGELVEEEEEEAKGKLVLIGGVRSGKEVLNKSGMKRIAACSEACCIFSERAVDAHVTLCL